MPGERAAEGRDVYRDAREHAAVLAGGAGWRRRVRGSIGELKGRVAAHEVFWRGSEVECPLCQRTYRRFRPQGRRHSARCPNPVCMTVERHRLLWLFLVRELAIGSAPTRILHIAPELGVAGRLKALPAVEHVGVDLESPYADVHASVTDLPFADGSFDVLICSHVLEHVPQDRQALRELRRVLDPGGTALVMYPVDVGREETDEDASVLDPHERRRRFGQFDHVRSYGRDHVARLHSSGFDVAVRRYHEEIAPSDRYRFGLEHPDGPAPVQVEGNTLFVCT